MSGLRLSFPLLLFICSNLVSIGQVTIVPNLSKLQTPKEYYLQVKQFGEFIDRFNYKSDWKGNLITNEFAKKISRANYLAYLLNAEDSRLGNSSDSTYNKLCGEFISFVDSPNNPITINLFSGQVKALAKVNIAYGGKNQSVNLELVPEILDDRSAKWVISKVEASCFASISDSLRTNFISPNSHETSFINIKKLNGSTDPLYFFSNNLATDPTILFVSEIAKNRLIIKNIEKVTYKVSLPGWVITVEEFNRSTNNSGWLISNIEKVKQE
jgi:hypothetical protein